MAEDFPSRPVTHATGTLAISARNAVFRRRNLPSSRVRSRGLDGGPDARNRTGWAEFGAVDGRCTVDMLRASHDGCVHGLAAENDYHDTGGRSSHFGELPPIDCPSSGATSRPTTTVGGGRPQPAPPGGMTATGRTGNSGNRLFEPFGTGKRPGNACGLHGIAFGMYSKFLTDHCDPVSRAVATRRSRCWIDRSLPAGFGHTCCFAESRPALPGSCGRC